MKPAPPVMRTRDGKSPSSVFALSFDELAETAFLSRRGLLLIKKSEVVLVELLEKLLPGNLCELRVRLTEVEAQHAGIVFAAGPLHPRRPATARLCPTSDGVVIGGGLRARHRTLQVNQPAERHFLDVCS